MDSGSANPEGVSATPAVGSSTDAIAPGTTMTENQQIVHGLIVQQTAKHSEQVSHRAKLQLNIWRRQAGYTS